MPVIITWNWWICDSGAVVLSSFLLCRIIDNKLGRGLLCYCCRCCCCCCCWKALWNLCISWRGVREDENSDNEDDQLASVTTKLLCIVDVLGSSCHGSVSTSWSVSAWLKKWKSASSSSQYSRQTTCGLPRRPTLYTRPARTCLKTRYDWYVTVSALGMIHM